MEEKKLTEEELLKAMEYCTKKKECDKNCRLYNVQGCMWIMFNQSFDLIRRLQNKNKLLKINLENECEEHKQFVKLAKQIDEEQKAEIERLTEVRKPTDDETFIWLLEGSKWEAYNLQEIPDLIRRLQSENKTLKTELRKECEEHEEFVKKAKAEIERLTEELDFYKCANRELTSTNEMLKGIVKNKGVEVE